MSFPKVKKAKVPNFQQNTLTLQRAQSVRKGSENINVDFMEGLMELEKEDENEREKERHRSICLNYSDYSQYKPSHVRYY